MKEAFHWFNPCRISAIIHVKNDHLNACVYALMYGDSANLSSSESGSLTA